MCARAEGLFLQIVATRRTRARGRARLQSQKYTARTAVPHKAMEALYFLGINKTRAIVSQPKNQTLRAPLQRVTVPWLPLRFAKLDGTEPKSRDLAGRACGSAVLRGAGALRVEAQCLRKALTTS